LKTRRDADLVMASDAVLEQHKDHWLVGETPARCAARWPAWPS
jgi:hypothetical protein